jgi:cyclopropane fatty-acyl-phospholipid synthase-like methyltransferase
VQRQFVERAASKYEYGICSDVRTIDFLPGSFDAIVSCYFWEHVKFEDKDLLIRSFYRWLRPGGKIVFLLDVASQNPLFNWARKQPEMWREGFIDHDGHYGLETASAALRRFAEQGFSVRSWHGINRSPVHPKCETPWPRRRVSACSDWAAGTTTEIACSLPTRAPSRAGSDLGV